MAVSTTKQGVEPGAINAITGDLLPRNASPHEKDERHIFKQKWREATSKPFVAYAISFTLGLVLIAVYHYLKPENTVSEGLFLRIAKELGIAYVVAAILGSTIETYNQIRHQIREQKARNDLEEQGRRLVNLINDAHSHNSKQFSIAAAKDVIEAVYGSTIPSEILKAATTFVLQAPKVRHGYNIRVELYILEDYIESCLSKGTLKARPDLKSSKNLDPSKQVVLIYTASWIDENTTSFTTDMDFPFDITGEGPTIENISGPQYLKIGRAVDEKFHGDPFVEVIGSAAFQNESLIASETGQLMLIRYRAKDVASHEMVRVEFQHVHIQDIEDDHVMQCIPPSVSARLTVKNSPKLKVTVVSIHTDDAKEEERTPIMRDDERAWSLPTAGLPCQGFILNWSPVAHS